MATTSQKALSKVQQPEEEYVTLRLPASRLSPNGKRLPILSIRHQVQKAGSGKSEIWATIGGLWLAKLPDGSMGFTLKISNFAPTFLSTGDALCMIPLPPRKENDEEQSE